VIDKDGNVINQMDEFNLSRAKVMIKNKEINLKGEQ